MGLYTCIIWYVYNHRIFITFLLEQDSVDRLLFVSLHLVRKSWPLWHTSELSSFLSILLSFLPFFCFYLLFSKNILTFLSFILFFSLLFLFFILLFLSFSLSWTLNRFEVEVCWIPDVTPEDLFDHLWREKDRHPTRYSSFLYSSLYHISFCWSLLFLFLFCSHLYPMFPSTSSTLISLSVPFSLSSLFLDSISILPHIFLVLFLSSWTYKHVMFLLD